MDECSLEGRSIEIHLMEGTGCIANGAEECQDLDGCTKYTRLTSVTGAMILAQNRQRWSRIVLDASSVNFLFLFDDENG